MVRKKHCARSIAEGTIFVGKGTLIQGFKILKDQIMRVMNGWYSKILEQDVILE